MNQSARAFLVLAIMAGPGTAQGIITTLAGSPYICSYSGDGGPASAATLCGINSPVADPLGAIFVQDNNRIRRIARDGTITSIAGNGQAGITGDGGPALSATISSNFVRQMAVSGSRICFADSRALKIRCVDQSTGLIQGYGTGVSGTGGDGGSVLNASFLTPSGVAFDDSGNLYISDFGANSVRRVDAVTGVITMFAGPGPGYCCVPVGDGGPALGADIYEPGQLAYFNGGLYIADAGNNRIRRVDLATGIISTVAGGGTGSADGIPALTAYIVAGAITLDPFGNLFISTQNRVRMVDTTGIITTIAGTGNSGAGYDDIPAIQTNFGGITGLAWDPLATRLLIGDFSTRLRQIFYTPATATTLSLTPNPVVPQGQVQLQATVSPATSAMSGSVRFYQDAIQPTTGLIVSTTFLGSMPLSNNTAAFTWTAPMSSTSCTYGACGLRAVYSGDFADNLSTSPTIVEGIQQGTTTTTFTSAANPSVQGQSVSFTATVTPSTATGVFFITNGTTQLGTYTVTNGAATFSIPNLPLGSNSLTAKYSGSIAYQSSTAILTQVVQSATTTSLVSSANPSVFGAPVTLTASVSPAAATGSVQFFNGVTSLGSAPLSNGQAQITLSNLPAGSNSLTAAYSGDAANAGSTSAALIQTVNPAASTTNLTANPPSATAGQSITLTAGVTPAAATGTIQFFDGTTALGTVTMNAGAAALSTAALSVGAHSITAVYSGDSSYSTSTSSALPLEISKIVTTAALASTPNPSAAGTPVALTAAILPATATGTVQFLDGATSLGAVTLSGGSASLSVTTLAVGSHSITAVYSGDAMNAASTSPALSQTISQVTTAATLASAQNPSTVGQAVTLTATVSPGTVTGSVQFFEGATVLGVSPVNAGAARLALSGLTAGPHSLTAVYSGDATNAPSTSAILTQTVNKAPSAVALASSANPAAPGQSVTFTASVSPAQATGTIQFLDGSTALGTAPINAATAVLTVPSLAAGAHSITAVYRGDATYDVSTASLSQIVKAITSTSLSASNLSPIVGQPVTLTAAVAPPSATGTVQFLDGVSLLGTASLAGGAASLTTASLAAGSHSLTAVYSGDSADTASTSAAVAVVVVRINVGITLASSLNPAVSGQPVVFTATLTAPAASGSVQLKDGTAVLATVPLSGGSAAFSVSTLAVGSHSITAVYSGDATDNPATSSVLTQAVNVAPPSNLAALGVANQINLTWTASATPGAVYNVYSATVPGFTPSPSNRIAAGVTATAYAQTNLSPNATRYYLVTAQYAGLESAPSNLASATTSTPSLSCQVGYTVTTQWNVGFGTAITIKNTGPKPINGWILTWTWPSSQQITQSWNSNYSQNGAQASLTNASWNATIGPGATIGGIGFNATYSGSNPPPTAFYVNGTLCR